jgi:hypothetical protein
MSTPVQTSLAGLTASTVKLMGIIAGAQHLPASASEIYLALTGKATTLLVSIIFLLMLPFVSLISG